MSNYNFEVEKSFLCSKCTFWELKKNFLWITTQKGFNKAIVSGVANILRYLGRNNRRYQ